MGVVKQRRDIGIEFGLTVSFGSASKSLAFGDWAPSNDRSASGKPPDVSVNASIRRLDVGREGRGSDGAYRLGMLSGVRPSVLLYDWDNTLVDGWAGITAALNAAFSEFGHPLWSVEDTRNRVRVSLRESFPVMFGDRWEHARDIFYEALTVQHLDHVSAMPGVPDVLETGAAWPQGVVSNKAGAFLRREVTHLGWARFFGSGHRRRGRDRRQT